MVLQVNTLAEVGYLHLQTQDTHKMEKVFVCKTSSTMVILGVKMKIPQLWDYAHLLPENLHFSLRLKT
jgi:hypothetical protein